MDWSKVKKEHIDAAIKKFIEEKPEHTKPRLYYLVYDGMRLPSKYIRGMAYSIATGEEFSLRDFNGGLETVNFFKKYGYLVEPISDAEEDKYSVNDAVWIATALLAAQQYSLDPNVNRDNMYFKQADIVKKAQSLIKSKVDSARVSWWVNADNKEHIRNYLRADSVNNPSFRRLAMMDEFSDKTYPQGLDMSDELEMLDRTITMEELFLFVKKQYPEVMKKMQKVDIDYIGVLNYLANNQQIPYSSPEAPELTQDDKNHFLNIKKKGQAATAEMKKMAAKCAELFGLDKCLSIPWLDASYTKTRKYLWAQLKYKEYETNPTSVSIFVEKNKDVTEYRISLEIKNVGTSKEMITAYHSHLDLPKEEGMEYVSGSNEWGNPIVLAETIDEIRQKINSGELQKVQLCIYVKSSPDKTNEEYDTEVMNAVKRIIPYYEYVIGKNSFPLEGAYWPVLEEYNPKITKDMWIQILHNSSVTSNENLFMLKCMKELGGESTCTTLAKTFGKTSAFYNRTGSSYGEKISKAYDIEPCIDDGQRRYFVIPFLGRYVQEAGKKRYSWKIRKELKEALEEMDLSDITMNVNFVENVKFDKNIILYGPPGTGKTYNTAIYAVAICTGRTISDVSSDPYSHVMEEYNKLKRENRVAFTTFHQSYGYEEFIEGIKPVVDQEKNEIGYTVEPGVFKKFCDKARSIDHNENDTLINAHAQIWQLTINSGDLNQIKQECFNEGNIRMACSFNDAETKIFTEKVAYGDIVLSLKSRNKIDGIGIVTGDVEELNTKDTYQLSRKVTWLATNIDEDITSINDDKPLSNMVLARVSSMQLKNILEIAQKYSSNEDAIKIVENTKPYVFIIDEINRGNISKIFGELITLIEETKRASQDEAISAILPYSGELFSVPSNVYILGTMNTADRSIALMDTALRRRFQFVEMMPDVEVLRNIGADKVDDLDIALMLEKINERITFLYDREHTIGHAFFTKLAKKPTIDTLQSIFEKSVIPLLQEYFYEDYQKIQLVLGDNDKSESSIKFILDEEVKVKNIFKGNIDEVIDLPEKKYSINLKAFGNLESYKQII